MPRYFEFKDEKSDKFWEIELHGNSYTVRFGKTGTNGQTQVKEFANEAAAAKEYNKLIEEKTKKGYVEQTAPSEGKTAAVERSNVIQMPLKTTSAGTQHAKKSAQKTAKDWKAEEEDDDDDDELEDEDDEPRLAKRADSATSSSVRRFEYEDDKSSKFWEISLIGSSFAVRFGRIGTEGQAQMKDFGSPAQAQKEYDKLIQEKVKKGYEEVASEDDENEDDQFDADDEDACESDDNEDSDGSTFAGFEIAEWDEESGIEDPNCAYKVALSYEEEDDDELEWSDKLGSFLRDPKASKVKALVVGSWGSQAMCEGESSVAVIEALVAAREQLPNLKAIFLADVDSDECEISWIQNNDVSPILEAYPNLTHFRVRGGMGLEFGTLKHKQLQSLIIESGGLSTDTVSSIANADLPSLQHLELWLGTSSYGGDYSVEDLTPIFEGKRFPKLRYLGLRNSELTDEIANALVNSPILKRIKILDLSMGTLGDAGAAALLKDPAIGKLEKLCVAHHYISEELIEQMEALPNVVGLDDCEALDNDDDRYCQVSE